MPRKILIADTNTTQRVTLRMIFKKAHYTLHFPDKLAELGDLLQKNEADIVFFAEDFLGLTCRKFCTFIRQNSPESCMGSMPVIFLGAVTDQKKRLKMIWDGIHDIIPYPCDEVFLLAYMRNYFRQRESDYEMKSREFYNVKIGLSLTAKTRDVSKKIACFSNDNPQINAIIEELKNHIPHPIIKRSREEEYPKMSDANGKGDDVCVIFADDRNMNSSLSLIPELRSQRETRFAALIFVFPYNMISIATMALDLSANSVVFMPVTSEELVLRILFQLERKSEADVFRLHRDEGLRLALRDSLTHLYNLRYVEYYKTHLQKQIARSKHTFAVFMIDLDYFKKINDKFGHIAGDDVLKAFAFRLNNNLRAPDIVARVGGEEFLVIIKTRNMTSAKRAANRLLKSCASQPFLLRSGEKINVTASIGVALNINNAQSVEESIKAADGALYLAKKKGRNMVYTVGATDNIYEPKKIANQNK